MENNKTTRFDKYVALQLLSLNIEVCQGTQYLSYIENQHHREFPQKTKVPQQSESHII